MAKSIVHYLTEKKWISGRKNTFTNTTVCDEGCIYDHNYVFYPAQNLNLKKKINGGSTKNAYTSLNRETTKFRRIVICLNKSSEAFKVIEKHYASLNVVHCVLTENQKTCIKSIWTRID